MTLYPSTLQSREGWSLSKHRLRRLRHRDHWRAGRELRALELLQHERGDVFARDGCRGGIPRRPADAARRCLVCQRRWAHGLPVETAAAEHLFDTFEIRVGHAD